MQSSLKTLQDYLNACPADQQEPFERLRAVINEHLPEGFEECFNYGMLGRVVPKSRYPDGYHCDPSLPLPFLNLAYRSKSINFYHMGLYSDAKLLEWFTSEYVVQCKRKLDMGKCCVRFKHYDEIPYVLIGELVSQVSVEEWIQNYESAIKK